MTGLDTRFVPLNYLETYFVDKDTGLPLSAGIVTFYQDNSRTTLNLKKIYKLTGTPPNYTYTELPNPCVLNGSGCFVDGSNNNVVPYAFPYDGDPDTSIGEVDLYYITVYSNDGHGFPAIPQWTREGQPNIGAQETNASELTNYITNGQFKIHNDLPNSGAISYDTAYLATGGWEYFRSPGSTASDFVTFPRFGSIIADPTTYPRYACRAQCTSPHLGDSYKYIIYYWPDVNKFASDSQKYTLFFSAQSNSGSPITVDIKLWKLYGNGGSPSPNEVVAIRAGLNITTSYANYNTSFVFGTNDGKIVGTNDDDRIAIIISLPAASTYDVSFTDFALVKGEIELDQFPIMTEGDMLSGTLFNTNYIRPNVAGMDLYLPVVLTPSGLDYSDADIGKVFMCSYSTPRIGELECAGQGLETTGYSSDGIPYLRLQQKLFNYTYNMPANGTGPNFVWSRIVSGSEDNIIVTSNTALAITGASDGSIPTGFSFHDITAGAEHGFDALLDSTGKIYAESDSGGPSNAVPSDGTSGFTVAYEREAPLGMTGLTTITSVDVSSISSLSGKYFKISNTTVDYYFWFRVDGVGADPAAGGTGVRIDLLSIHTITDVRQIINDALSGYYIFNLQTVDGGSLTAGSYFNFYTSNGDHYYVWYRVDGLGDDPVISGAKF